jgi:opacity protein-like surface antigen
MASPEQDAASKLFQPPPAAQAGMYVFRDSSLGGRLKKTVKIDGVSIGRTAPNVFLHRLVQPGSHTLATESEFSDNDLEFEAQAGENHYFRQSIKMGLLVGGARLSPVDQEAGRRGVTACEEAIGLPASGSDLVPAREGVEAAPSDLDTEDLDEPAPDLTTAAPKEQSADPSPIKPTGDGIGEADTVAFDLFLGTKSLSKKDWSIDNGSSGPNLDLSELDVFGISFAGMPADGGIGKVLSFRFAHASDDDDFGGERFEGSSTSFEVGLGGRKTFHFDEFPVHPYLGAGLAVISTTIDSNQEGPDVDLPSADGIAFGLYLQGGAMITINDSVSLGLTYRVLTGADYNGDLDGADADYGHLMFTLGFIF